MTNPKENPREDEMKGETRGEVQEEAVLEDRVIREHRHLETLFEEVGRFVSDGESTEVIVDAFSELVDELETHFDQEACLYYPAIWGIRPELEESLSDLIAQHQWFRDQLRRIADHFAHEELENGSELFRKVAEAFHIHEHAEEEILGRLGLGE